MDPELKELKEQMQSLLDEFAMISGGEEEGEDMEKQDEEGEGGPTIDSIQAKISAGEALTDEEQQILDAALGAYLNGEKSEDKEDYEGSENANTEKATASDSAEERVDDVTDISEEAQDVVKALKHLATVVNGQAQKSNGGQSVQKKGDQSGYVQALQTVAKSVQALNQKVDTVGQAVEGIFDALEISDDVIKSQLGEQGGQQKSEDRSVEKSGKTPKQGGENDTAQVLKALLEQYTGQQQGEDQTAKSESEEVRKDLGQALQGIFSGKTQ
jgi:hypothetical protein